MRHTRLLILLLLLFPFTAHSQAPAPAHETNARAVKSAVETIQFESKLVGAKLPYSVVLPPEYNSAEARTKSFPVLYLLHGLTGHYSDWLSKSKLADHAARYQFIVVTPEGNNGWYTDSNVAPSDQYESYIIKELIPDVEKRFRAVASRHGRAVAGLSMGGYGALKFGLKYPEVFAFAASLSGALEATSFNPDDPQMPQWVKPSIERAYGKIDNPSRAANDVFKIIRELPAERVASLPYIYVDCGTEDFLIASNMKMAALLVERKIPHEYRQLPGKHDWPYWDGQVQEVLRIMAQRMPSAIESKAAGTSASK